MCMQIVSQWSFIWALMSCSSPFICCDLPYKLPWICFLSPIHVLKESNILSTGLILFEWSGHCIKNKITRRSHDRSKLCSISGTYKSMPNAADSYLMMCQSWLLPLPFLEKNKGNKAVKSTERWARASAGHPSTPISSALLCTLNTPPPVPQWAMIERSGRDSVDGDTKQSVPEVTISVGLIDGPTLHSSPV